MFASCVNKRHDSILSCCVQEGFLLGKVTNVVKNTISDADMSVVERHVVYSTLMFSSRRMICACE